MCLTQYLVIGLDKRVQVTFYCLNTYQWICMIIFYMNKLIINIYILTMVMILQFCSNTIQAQWAPFEFRSLLIWNLAHNHVLYGTAQQSSQPNFYYHSLFSVVSNYPNNFWSSRHLELHCRIFCSHGDHIITDEDTFKLYNLLEVLSK